MYTSHEPFNSLQVFGVNPSSTKRGLLLNIGNKMRLLTLASGSAAGIAANNHSNVDCPTASTGFAQPDVLVADRKKKNKEIDSLSLVNVYNSVSHSETHLATSPECASTCLLTPCT
jgi:hypothetical protein